MATFYVHFIDNNSDQSGFMPVYARDKERAEYENQSTSRFEITDVLDEQEHLALLAEMEG